MTTGHLCKAAFVLPKRTINNNALVFGSVSKDKVMTWEECFYDYWGRWIQAVLAGRQFLLLSTFKFYSSIATPWCEAHVAESYSYKRKQDVPFWLYEPGHCTHTSDSESKWVESLSRFGREASLITTTNNKLQSIFWKRSAPTLSVVRFKKSS